MIINLIVFYRRYTCTILNWLCLLKFPQAWHQTHANACPVWCSMRKSSKEILWVCGDNRYKCWSCFDSWEPLQKHRYLRLPISQQQQIYNVTQVFLSAYKPFSGPQSKQSCHASFYAKCKLQIAKLYNSNEIPLHLFTFWISICVHL